LLRTWAVLWEVLESIVIGGVGARSLVVRDLRQRNKLKLLSPKKQCRRNRAWRMTSGRIRPSVVRFTCTTI